MATKGKQTVKFNKTLQENKYLLSEKKNKQTKTKLKNSILSSYDHPNL